MIHETNRLMIDFVKDETHQSWKGYFYAVAMFMAALINSLINQQYFQHTYAVGMRIRSGLIAAIYRKVSNKF